MMIEKRIQQREVLSRELFLIGAAYLVFYAALLVIHTTALFSRVGLHNTGTLLAVVVALSFYGLIGIRVYRLSAPQLLSGLLVMLLITVLSGFIAGYFLDLSWDGRDYHQKAIRELASGWNPIYATIQPEDYYKNAWLNHYPKGPWLSAASISLLTGDIEIGKTFNQLLIWAVFFVGFAYFLTYPQLQIWKAFLLSFFLAVNPVSISQFLSYYIDGQVSSSIILLILLMLLSLRREDLGVWVTLAAAIIVGLNIKFTGTAYILLTLVIFVPVSVYKKKPFSALRTLWAAVLVGALVGGFVVGYNPFISNTLRYGHPFYPIIGDSQFNKTFVLRGQMPPNFTNINRVEKLYLSVFSRSQNKVGKPGHLKIPFTVEESEIISFSGPDVRIGGWGPLFGALTFLSAVAWVPLLLISRRIALVASLLIGLILFVTLLNRDAWWARYAPQLWLIPVIALAALWIAKDKWLGALGIIMATAMMANVLLVSVPYVSFNYTENKHARSTLNDLLKAQEDIFLYYGPLEAVAVRLREIGIPYRRAWHRSELVCPAKLEPWVYYSPLDCSP